LRLRCIASAALFACTVASADDHDARPNSEIVAVVRSVSAARIEAADRKLVSFGTRNSNSTQTDPSRGIGAARDWIAAEFSRISVACGGCLTVEQQTFTQPAGPRVPKPVAITNVIATLTGTIDPTRLHVVSGHYDSMCGDPSDGECDAPGANDDASGTAAVIEMARVLSQRRYDATLIFTAVAGEEQGLLGSTHFAERAQADGLQIESMFTNDIIGGVTTFKDRPDRNSVRVFTEGVAANETARDAAVRAAVGGENDSPTRQLGRYVREMAALYTPDFEVRLIYRRDRYLRGGDHMPFLARGYPAVRFTEPHEDYTHQHQNVRTQDGVFYGDTIDYVDPAYIASVTRVNVAALAALALAPMPPRDAALDTRQLTNDTRLTWRANSEADLAGYEIVWRETTAPYWTDTLWVGNVTDYTLQDRSKDNYFFGVRAVDNDGNRSPVAFPSPRL
jgi:Zn-dependent M28 family amino/carboxypeptidase